MKGSLFVYTGALLTGYDIRINPTLRDNCKDDAIHWNVASAKCYWLEITSFQIITLIVTVEININTSALQRLRTLTVGTLIV